MGSRFLIYGASGYTGRLCASLALEAGLEPILAGRDRGRVAAIAGRLGCEYRLASADGADRLASLIADVDLVLNAAGPFTSTARSLALACIRTGTHYADLGADPNVFESLLALDEAARAAEVVILPGVGFDVVASDCLALHVAQRAGGARKLRIALGGLELVSRGSAKGFVEHAGLPTLVRRAGQLVSIPPASLEWDFEFGLDARGPRRAIAVSWGDVVTAYQTTGVPDIEVYFEAIPAVRMLLLTNRLYGWMMANPISQVFLKTSTALLPEGPSERDRENRQVVVVVEAERADGSRISSRLYTPEAYTFSARSAIAVSRRILGDHEQGRVATGFQTPAGCYGADLVLEIEGVRREDGHPDELMRETA